MVDIIKDPVFLGQVAMMNFGAILTTLVMMIFLSWHTIGYWIIGIVGLVDLLVILRSAQAIAKPPQEPAS